MKFKDSDFFVLVVDDDAPLREALVTNLELEGFTVLSASDGKDALDVLRKNEKINFVLSDIRMPEMDGMEFLHEVRKINPTIPVVCLITGFSEYTRERAIENGAIDLLLKPPKMESIYAYIRNSRSDD